MASQQESAALGAPPKADHACQKAAALLNSRFSTFRDLDALESLVWDAEERHVLLQTKLVSSKLETNALLAEARHSTSIHLHTASELSLLRHSLTDELAELIPELTSTMSNGEGTATLLEELETLQRSLKELQSVKGYVQVIQHALKLSEGSIEHIRALKSPVTEESLKSYQNLIDFVSRVSEAGSTLVDSATGSTEEEKLHLVQFLEKVRDRTWLDIQDCLSGTLVECGERIGWPMSVDYPATPPEDRGKFERAFQNLLELQRLGEKLLFPSFGSKGGCYAIQALVRPIVLRFKYHFDGKRETNRIDKPEWYFTHILNLAHDHKTLMQSVIQRLLASSYYTNLDAWSEFTTSLLSILERKLKQTIPSLLPHPSLLAHTIYQTLLFDTALAEEGFKSSNASAEGQWEGVSNIILGNAEWFDTWLLAEQKFAEDQYHDIISASDAWSIEADEEDSRNKDVKSTHSARRVCSLVEQVTDRYSPLPRLVHRIRFLLSCQLPLLDQYHSRITASLDAFETLSSVLVRAVPGALGVNLGSEEATVHVDKQGLTGGVTGVQRLCKALLSARHIDSALHRWGEELFFVELWTEMNQQHNAGNQTIYSTSLLPKLKTGKEDLPNGTLFDVLASRYQTLITRAEDMIVYQVCGEVENVLKPHLLADHSSETTDVADDFTLPQSLLVPVALLSSHLTFLRTVLSPATLTALYRRITSRLAEYILQRQIKHRGRFSAREGKLFCAEYELWVASCDTALGGALGGGRARVEAPWAKLLQVGSLVGAEGGPWSTLLDATFGVQSDDEWEEMLTQMLGSIELEREEVAQLLRRREDCER